MSLHFPHYLSSVHVAPMLQGSLVGPPCSVSHATWLGFPAQPVLFSRCYLAMLSSLHTHSGFSCASPRSSNTYTPKHLQPTRWLCNQSPWRTISHALPWPGMRLLCFAAEADSWRSRMAHLASYPPYRSVLYLQHLSTSFLMTTHAGVWTPPALLSLSIVSNIHLHSQRTV